MTRSGTRGRPLGNRSPAHCCVSPDIQAWSGWTCMRSRPFVAPAWPKPFLHLGRLGSACAPADDQVGSAVLIGLRVVRFDELQEEASRMSSEIRDVS